MSSDHNRPYSSNSVADRSRVDGSQISRREKQKQDCLGMAEDGGAGSLGEGLCLR